MHDLLSVPRVMFPLWINEAAHGLLAPCCCSLSCCSLQVPVCPVLSLFLGVVSTAAAHHPSLTLSLCSPRDVRSH